MFFRLLCFSFFFNLTEQIYPFGNLWSALYTYLPQLPQICFPLTPFFPTTAKYSLTKLGFPPVCTPWTQIKFYPDPPGKCSRQFSPWGKLFHHSWPVNCTLAATSPTGSDDLPFKAWLIKRSNCLLTEVWSAQIVSLSVSHARPIEIT